jgi:hypothetical protein
MKEMPPSDTVRTNIATTVSYTMCTIIGRKTRSEGYVIGINAVG